MRAKPTLAASFTLLSLFLSPPAFSQSALDLFHKMQEALGGADKIADVHDYEQVLRAESWDSRGRSGEVRKRTRWVRPNYLRADQTGPGSTYVLYFDGTSGWEILPGTQTVAELVGGELKFAQKYLRDFVLTTWLADRDPHYRIDSPASNVVRISDGDVTHQLDIMLDPVSWLPVKTASVSLADPAHPIPSETIVAEWDTVQGIRFARRWSVFRSGVRVAEATVEQTRLNSGLKPADLAAKPSDSKPVLSEGAPAAGNPR